MPEVKETVEPPAWLDLSFIQDALRQGLKNKELRIHQADIQPAVAVGDNYASQMFRAKLEMTQNGEKNCEEKSIVIKSLPEGEHMKETVHRNKFFLKETKMIVETIPEIQKLLDKVKPNQYETLCAKCYYHQGAPRDIIIMEDLTKYGFRLANRYDGLDLDHTFLVVDSLARFHATSLVLAEKQPDIKEMYRGSAWGEDEKVMKVFKSSIKALAEELEFRNYSKKYVDLLNEVEKTVDEKILYVHRLDESKVNVLLHGDVWVNNMMFKYDGKKVESIKFVDFQLATWNSPVLDLLYFIFTSVSPKIQLSHLDRITERYHNTFMEILKTLNYSLSYSLNDFLDDFNDRLFFGFLAGVFVFPIVIAPPNNALDVNDLFDESTGYNNKQVYQNEKCLSVLIDLLHFFRERKAI